ncbi:MAG: hypothetical protein H0U69_04335 [Trueperaceae bacterium]|nr:hypothetical protein [Trueperaceae bacterium]
MHHLPSIDARLLPVHRVVYVVGAMLTLVGATFAQQPVDWTETGVLQLELEGEASQFHTYSTLISEEMPDDVDNELAQEMLDDLAGTTQHTARWMVPETRMMGTIVLMKPTVMFVSISARPQGDDRTPGRQIMLDFGLDLATLELAESASATIRYYLEGYTTSDYYALTEGGLEVTSVERIDEHTLRITGAFAGAFTHQGDWRGIEHNPTDALSVQADFDFLQVVGRDLLSEVLLEGE